MSGKVVLNIGAGKWAASLLPDLGGALASLRFGDVDVLRPASAGVTDPLVASSFALVPYANRIAGGRFQFGGREYRVPLNFRDHPHALHGLGWQTRWEVADRSESSATLRHSHEGGSGWPWAYQAEQRVALSEEGLSASLSITNLADEPTPFSLGFHPYFEAPEGTLLKTSVSHVWLADETCIPERRVEGNWFGDWSTGQAVDREELIDHSFGGWDGSADVIRPDLPFLVRLTASPELRNLHLYMPPGERFFCAEPVGNMPDAPNRPDADESERLRVLQPGETLRASMEIRLEPK